ncbi:hypothetical protein JW935_11540 [candidate division KSB1 bacterium]|nr:hypothetical protein [candidate division KSB1 bacterium]
MQRLLSDKILEILNERNEMADEEEVVYGGETNPIEREIIEIVEKMDREDQEFILKFLERFKPNK